MALTVAQLASAIRVDLGGDADLTAIVQRLLDVADAIVQVRSAVGTPVTVRDQATIQVAGYLYDRPSGARPGRLDLAGVYVASGARDLLDPWLSRRAVPVGDAPEAAGPAAEVDVEAVRAIVAEALAAFDIRPKLAEAGVLYLGGD